MISPLEYKTKFVKRVSWIFTASSLRVAFGFFALLLSLYSRSSFADEFKVNCDIQGTIPVLDDKALPPVKAVLMIQTLGNNIFIQIVGPSPYEMKVNTLETKLMSGKNLTNPKHLGARVKNKTTGQETEIVLDYKTVALSGYNDIEYQKQMVRLVLTGQCVLPK
jgi:hypothetical protein